MDDENYISKFKNCLLSFEGVILTEFGCLVAKSVHEASSANLVCNIMNTSNQQIRLKDKKKIGYVMACELADNANCSKEEYISLNNTSGKRVQFEDRISSHDDKMKNIDSIRIGPELDEKQKFSLRALLYRNHDRFAWNDQVLGRTNLVTHKVPTGSHSPVEQYQYPIPSVRSQERAS